MRLDLRSMTNIGIASMINDRELIAEKVLIWDTIFPASKIPVESRLAKSTRAWKMTSIQKLRVDAYIVQNKIPIRAAEIT